MLHDGLLMLHDGLLMLHDGLLELHMEIVTLSCLFMFKLTHDQGSKLKFQMLARRYAQMTRVMLLLPFD